MHGANMKIVISTVEHLQPAVSVCAQAATESCRSSDDEQLVAPCWYGVADIGK